MYDSNMRQQRYHTNPEHTKQTFAALWSAASRSQGKHTTTEFLRSVLTETEQMLIGRRLLIAQRLLKGHSWSHIRAELHVSPNTINLVQTWLTQKIPEYETATQTRIERSKQAKKPRKRRVDSDPTSWRTLRRKYPGHFLLWNLILDDLD